MYGVEAVGTFRKWILKPVTVVSTYVRTSALPASLAVRAMRGLAVKDSSNVTATCSPDARGLVGVFVPVVMVIVPAVSLPSIV